MTHEEQLKTMQYALDNVDRIYPNLSHEEKETIRKNLKTRYMRILSLTGTNK